MLQEQEQSARIRVVELAKTNEAISKNLTTLTATPELDDFLGQILAKINESMEACKAHLFLYDEETDSLQQYITVQDGQTHIGYAPTDPDMFRHPIPTNTSPAWAEMLKSSKPWTLDASNPETAKLWWQDSLPWHQAEGHQAATCAVLRVGHQPIGFLCVIFRHLATLTDEQLEFIQALTNQATLAIHLTRLADQAQTTALNAALTDERNRLAREIHDTLAQSFTGISLQLEAARSITRKVIDSPGPSPTPLEDAQAYILRARDLARKGLSEARRSVRALRSEALETDSLPEALQKIIQQTQRDTGLTTRFYQEGTSTPIPDDIELNFLRIAQEAITNTLRYANATQLDLTLSFTPHQIRLSIIDNGIGFDTRQSLAGSGFGLIGIRERAARFGGSFELLSSPDIGTILEVVIPLDNLRHP